MYWVLSISTAILGHNHLKQELWIIKQQFQ
jgi:hypothetical protein